MAIIPITCSKISKSENTYPKSDFTFGKDSSGNQILVAAPVKATFELLFNNTPPKYDLEIIVAIDKEYNGTPSLYYNSDEQAFIVEFNYKHESVPDNLYKWTLSVTNGDIKNIPNKPKKVYLYDTVNSSNDTMVNEKGVETSKGTEVAVIAPPEKD